MPITFSKEEESIRTLFSIGTTFNYDNVSYEVIEVGKPFSEKGEPKTDIYICAISKDYKKKEFKISFKKSNADFLENKISKERAQQLFGKNWSKIIKQSIDKLKPTFQSKTLIYKEQEGHTEKGSITLGWKFELVNKISGALSDEIILVEDQVIDVYAGTNLEDEKKNARVNEKIINDSGVANFILIGETGFKNAQEVIDKLISVKDYVKQHPKVYFACKALNYRTLKDKWDGDRPLAVYVEWSASSGKLSHSLVFNKPLEKKGNEVAKKLKTSLEILNITTIDDIDI